MTISITVAMKAVLDLATEMGVTDINRLPYCWELTVDECWWIAVNGHAERTRCFPPTHPDGSQWPNVPAYGVYAERYGWPAVMFDASSGCWIGSPELEDELIAAIKAKAHDVYLDKHALRLPMATGRDTRMADESPRWGKPADW